MRNLCRFLHRSYASRIRIIFLQPVFPSTSTLDPFLNPIRENTSGFSVFQSSSSSDPCRTQGMEVNFSMRSRTGRGRTSATLISSSTPTSTSRTWKQFMQNVKVYAKRVRTCRRPKSFYFNGLKFVLCTTLIYVLKKEKKNTTESLGTRTRGIFC